MATSSKKRPGTRTAVSRASRGLLREKARIVFVANLWALEGHPSLARPWSLARKVRAVRAAGFDAVMAPASESLTRLLRRHELRFTGFFCSSDPRQFSGLLRAQRLAGAENVTVQIGKDSTPVAVASKWALALQREAERQGIFTAIEGHRATALETPEKIMSIADAYRRSTGRLLPLTWDYSHLAVVKHLKPFQFPDLLRNGRELLQATRLLHARPFNGQHAQVPVFNSARRLTPEFRTWLGFMEDVFRCWLEGPRDGGELWVCPEIGPRGVHGYNLSTMPASWEQAMVCKRELDRIWRRLVSHR